MVASTSSWSLLLAATWDKLLLQSWLGASTCLLVLAAALWEGGGCSLWRLLCRHFSEEALWDILIGISRGLQHIHDARILHRDIKGPNIFLDANGNVKIGDFGLGRMLGPQVRAPCPVVRAYVAPPPRNTTPRAQSAFANTAVGTPLYFSPEVVEEREYNARSDMWSLGCLMYELATLRPPFLASNHLALAK